jgi:hypothetical protein
MVQVLVLNNVTLPGVFNPYIYIYFIMTLPLMMSHTSLVLVSFLCGLGVDIFSNSMGIHAFTCTFIGFLRPYIITLLKPSGGYNPDDKISLHHLGFRWFLMYTLFNTFLMHFVLFLVETLSTQQLILVMNKAISSSLLATTIIILTEYFFYNRKK